MKFLNIEFMKIMKFDLKWVHMVRYELILKLDGALWLTIISKKTDPKKGHGRTKKRKRIPSSCLTYPVYSDTKITKKHVWHRHR